MGARKKMWSIHSSVSYPSRCFCEGGFTLRRRVLLGRCRVREDIAKFVDDFLADLVFEEIVVARGAQHSRFQDFVLLVKQFVEFESHLLGAMICHRVLCDEWRAKGQ